MLNYKQIWHGIKPIRWLNKFNLTSCFWKVLCFCKNCQKLYCPVLATQSRVEPVPSRESITEIFRDSLATHWRVNASVAKKTQNIFQKFGISCFSRLRLATCSWVEGLVARGTQRFSWLNSRLFHEWNFQLRKTLRNFFKSFLSSVLVAGPGDLNAT